MKNSQLRLTAPLLAFLAITQFATAQTNLTGRAAEIFRKAQTGKYFTTAAKLNPEYLPTSDRKSFLVVWRATGTNTPSHWIVSLSGHEGFATDDLAIWSPHLLGRDVGLISVQWWIGNDNSRAAYLTPEQIYREVDLALQRLGAKTNSVMFHGFSRGSANTYPIAALDAGRGKKYFALNVASSGAVALDYPPIKMIAAGGYGEQPLKGTRWVTAAGGRDQNPERDGIPAMRRTAAWLKDQGASVSMSIEDPNYGHGALMLNPANTRKLIDLFLADNK